MATPSILFCQCANAAIVPEASRDAVLEQLRRSGVAFLSTPDLCELSARHDPVLHEFAQVGAVRIAACYPRAVRGLFAAAGATLSAQAQVFNLRVETPESVCAGLGLECAAPGAGCDAQAAKLESALQPGGRNSHWKPWFPVIDYERCTGCLQCLSFCLFGVYAVDGQSRIAVENPEQCKTNCPACSRICPEAAIVFPKHSSSPINGDTVPPSDVTGRPAKVDISALLGGDVYSRLRARGGAGEGRFSGDRDPETALRERQRFLALAAGDIPPEVFASLPPMEELARRAAEAQEKTRQSQG